MNYQDITAQTIKEGAWNEKTCVRREGGYDVDKATLPADMAYLPKGAVMAINPTTGVAALVHTAKVHAAATSATAIQVEKGHSLKVGDAVLETTITAINTSNTAYDVLTLAAAKSATLGQVIATATANVAGLNYATVKVDAFPTCTITVQAYEIDEASLPFPVNADIKQALTPRHAFKI